MDKNTIIGITLIFVLFIGYQQFMAPSPEEIERNQRMRDSLARVEQLAEATIEEEEAPSEETATPQLSNLSDSARLVELGGLYGPFAPASQGSEQTHVLENDVMRIELSNKGGRIRSIQLLEYQKITEDEQKNEVELPLYLMANEDDKFEYVLPIASVPSGAVRTSDLYFEMVQADANKVVFRTSAGEGRYFEQTYTIEEGTYQIDYDIEMKGLQQILSSNVEAVQLHWLTHLDKLEKNDNYERNYSTVYYKPIGDDSDHCSCTSNDVEDLSNEAVKWVSNSNQFFNTTLVADDNFSAAVMETQSVDEDAPVLKIIKNDLMIPYNRGSSEAFSMSFYAGPNDYERLHAIGSDLTDIIPFGQSIFGAINRHIIRPIFNFLDKFIGNKGIAILVLTLFVKILVFPLTYRMLKSQSKMAALKPILEKQKAKHKDDQKAAQMEQMKLYREYGVNPLGGCFPMLLQMPIWFALYRFFPASITFRQADFLWATDLSSYDVLFNLPFEVPLGFGSHVSLFALLWAGTTLIYTYYNTRHMDYSAQPAMKYMQYLMPMFFLGFFNSFASGLTCYLFFSNLINIAQTLLTKEVIIDKDKLRNQLEANKNKPKKKGGFQERLEMAMKEQQKRQAAVEASKAKKKKKGKAKS